MSLNYFDMVSPAICPACKGTQTLIMMTNEEGEISAEKKPCLRCRGNGIYDTNEKKEWSRYTVDRPKNTLSSDEIFDKFLGFDWSTFDFDIKI